MTAPLVDRLRALLPPGAVVAGADVSPEQTTDASRVPVTAVPAALVRASTTAEVSAVLALAHEAGTPVVAQGGRSGLVGAANAIDGAILLDLSGMRALRIDRADRLAIAQPGVIVADLQRAAADVGLFYPPDPASADRATVGGTIATNAGGLRCIKYGITRDAVRSLEIVLADGQIVRTRPATTKGVASLDITGLVVGSEGTLAVVTEATLALRPAPGPSRGVAATFPSALAAFEAANVLADRSPLPAMLEFLDEVPLRGIRILRPDLPIPGDAAAWLLAVTDEPVDDLDDYAAVFRAHGALSIERADGPADLERVFEARRLLSPALLAVRGGGTHGDLAVPRSALPALAVAADGIRAEFGVELSLAGHVGDGNLHPTVVFDPADPEGVDRAHAAADRLGAVAQSLGGTIAGEHGIGTVKRDAVVPELDPGVRVLQQALKQAFDPRGILNPGRKL